MTIIRDLLWNLDLIHTLPNSEHNPLKEENGLFEAILLDVQYMPLLKRVLLLFDFRSSLSADEGNNTGILICEKVSRINLKETGDFGLWVISTIKVKSDRHGILEITLADMTQPIITIEATEAIFLYGYVEGIGEIADGIELDNLRTFMNTIPSLSSSININSMSRLLGSKLNLQE